MKDKEFEDIVRNIMLSPDEEPADDTWQQIRTGVDRHNKKKRRLVFYFVAAGLAIVGSALFYYAVPHKGPISAAMANKISSSTNFVAGTAMSQTLTPQVSKKTVLVPTIPKNNSNNELRASVTKRRELHTSQTSTALINNLDASSILPEYLPLEDPIISLEHRPLGSFTLNLARPDFSTANLSPIARTKDSMSRHAAYWAIGVQGSFGAGTYNLPNSYDRILKSRITAAGAELSLVRHFGRISISAGLGYQHWQITTLSQYDERYTYEGDSIKVINRSRAVFYHHRIDTGTRLKNQSYSESLGMMSIPVMLRYAFKPQGKLVPYTGIGGTFSRLLSGKADKYYGTNRTAEVTSYKNMSRSQCQVNITAGFAYKISKSLNAEASAVMGYQFSSLYTSSSPAHRACILYFKAGLFYHL